MGAASVNEKAIFLIKCGVGSAKFTYLGQGEAPLSGIRILDLTRVIAGPTCTQFLASWGADVLRIDPPGFEEVASLLPETTVGKKCASLDLKTAEGKKLFEVLLKQADVIVSSLRAGALYDLGFSSDQLKKINPDLILAQVNAYGWQTPWTSRRGFDSLVQMSTGIAARGAEQKKSFKPFPMPAQALDYGSGYLMAAGICQALTNLLKNNEVSAITCSLVGVANFLFEGPIGNIHADNLTEKDFLSCVFKDTTHWGNVSRVMPPGLIAKRRGQWTVQAGPLGRHEAKFSDQ